MNQTPLFKLLEAKLGRDPIEDLRERRGRGEKWRAIERTYLLEHGVSVTDVTLRSWLAAAEQSTPA